MTLQQPFSRKCKVYAYLSTDQLNLVHGAWTKVAFDSEFFDVLGEFDTTNNRFVAAASGYYLIIASLCFTSSVAEKFYFLSIVTSNSSYEDITAYIAGRYRLSQENSFSHTGGCPYMKCHAIVWLDAGDIIELYVQSAAGADTADIASAPGETYLSITGLAH